MISSSRYHSAVIITILFTVGIIGCDSRPNCEASKSIINPLDTIPIENGSEKVDFGYFKRLRENGTTAGIVHACDKRPDGINLFFYENGFLRVYTEYNNGVQEVKISYNDDGSKGYCILRPDDLLVLDGKDSIPEAIMRRLEFIEENCMSLTEMNWDLVLINQCN